MHYSVVGHRVIGRQEVRDEHHMFVIEVISVILVQPFLGIVYDFDHPCFSDAAILEILLSHFSVDVFF